MLYVHFQHPSAGEGANGIKLFIKGFLRVKFHNTFALNNIPIILNNLVQLGLLHLNLLRFLPHVLNFFVLSFAFILVDLGIRDSFRYLLIFLLLVVPSKIPEYKHCNKQQKATDTLDQTQKKLSSSQLVKMRVSQVIH